MLSDSIKQITNKIKNSSSEIMKKIYNKSAAIRFPDKIFGQAADFAKNASMKFIFNSSAAIMLLMAVMILPAGNLSFGYKIVCDGETAGTVYKRAEALAAYNSAKEELKKIPSAREVSNAKIILTIANKEAFSSENCLENAVVAVYDGREDCFGIYVDGALAATLPSEKEAKELLESYKGLYKTDSDISVGFNKNVEIKPARAVKEEIKDVQTALNVLKAPKGGITTYQVKKGDTASQIAEAHGITTAKLLSVNPGITADSIREGDILAVSDTTPLLAVKTTSQVTEKATVQYETEKIEDSNEYKGTTVTVRNGVTGEKQIEYSIVKENGIEISRKTINETITKEPVSAMVKVGTKERPATNTTGIFKMPYYGVLTSRYGSYRSRGIPHTGIDLAGPTGSAICAADGGTVSFAGWKNSYGNIVIIKHDNGYETYYAHMSAIYVSAGQKVSQGQTLGAVGSTGNSTGPHLHFEIRKNGTPLNPQNYLR